MIEQAQKLALDLENPARREAAIRDILAEMDKQHATPVFDAQAQGVP